MTVTIDEMSGLRKAAVLLVQLGKERSAQVLKSLRESEIEVLTAEIARLDDIEPDVAGAVLVEFQQLAAARHYYAQGGLSYAEEVLVATLGPDKAREVLGRLKAVLVEMPFQFLRRVDPQMVLSFLQDEHPQTITLVLAHMDPKQAAAVLSGLDEQVQADIAHRLAVMERTSPDVVKQVESYLQRRLSTVLQPNEFAAVGGLQPLVDIINHSDRNTERLILEGLEQRSTELAEEVRARMFMFEDVDAARGPRRADPAALGRQQGPGRGAQGRQGRGPRQVRLQHVGAGRPRPGRGHGRARTRPGQAGGGGAGRHRPPDPRAGGVRRDRGLEGIGR